MLSRILVRHLLTHRLLHLPLRHHLLLRVVRLRAWKALELLCLRSLPCLHLHLHGLLEG